MSRTYRNSQNPKVYRHPKTFNERKQLDSFAHDEEVTLTNRDKAKLNSLSDAYDDEVKSGFYEDFNWKHY